MNITDHELMNRLCAGETDRLGDLYDRHAPGVLRHCRHMVQDAEAARDLTQEVFLRVFRYRSTWEGRSRFTTWLYRITRNVCLDHLKREERRRELHGQTDTAGEVSGRSSDRSSGRSSGSSSRNVPGEWSASGPFSEDPIAGMEAAETTNQLMGALDRLTPTYREVILLVRYQDMSYDEVSRVLECSVNAARVRFHRAIQALRKEYMKSGRTRI